MRSTEENAAWQRASVALFDAFRGTRAVFAGTCAEYDWSHECLMEDETPLKPRTPYGAAKNATRAAVEAIAAARGVSVGWGRLFFLYGPHEPRGRLVSDLCEGLLAERDIELSAGIALIRCFAKPIHCLAIALRHAITVGVKAADSNLSHGIALIRQGDAAGGTRWLDALGQMPAANEEQRALRDQANLALGYAALQREAPEQARQYLERIRLKGPSSDKALLGYGWATLGLKQPKLALVSWTELAQRDPSQPAVQEARLAVSYALAELGADTQARDGYQSALGSYQDEDHRLGEAIAALDDPAWLDELLARNPGVEMAWFRDAEDVPHLPHLRLLAPALAGHAFQESFKTWRDLRFLQDNLAAWQETLAVYRTMLDERRKAFQERLPDVASQRQQLNPAALLPRQQQLDGELAQAEADADGHAFADPAQRALLQRADRARDTLARLQAAPANPEVPAATLQDAAERLRILQGLLAWDLSQAYPERRWAARKALGDSAQGLQQAQTARQALDQAARDEAQRFVQFQQRIDELSRRIQALQAPLATASSQQAQALSRLAQDGLRQQQERLAGYAQQARYALAQLLDRGRDASTEPEHAPTP